MDTLITLCIVVAMALGLTALGLGAFVITPVPARPRRPTGRRKVGVRELAIGAGLL